MIRVSRLMNRLSHAATPEQIIGRLIIAQENGKAAAHTLRMRTAFAVALLYIFLAILLLWPLPTALGSAVLHDDGDSLLNVWIIAWDIHSLSTNPGMLLNPNIFYPHQTVLAYSEYLLFPALLAWPVVALTGNPLLAHNGLLLLAYAGSAFTMFLLAFAILRHVAAAIIAGIIYSFYPYRLEMVTQIQFVSAYWLPLGLLGLLQFLRSERRSRYAWLALFYGCIILQALTSIYLTFFLAIAAFLMIAGMLRIKRRQYPQILLPLLAGGVLALLILLPAGLPYLQVNRESGFSRSIQQVIFFSADVKDYLSAPPSNLVYGVLTAVMRNGSRFSQSHLWPGLVTILLAILGWWDIRKTKRGRVWIYAALLVVLATVLTLGPFLIAFGQPQAIPLPYLLLYYLVPGFQSLRSPVRFICLSTLGLALLAGSGLVWLGNRWPLHRHLIYGAAMGLIVLECLSPQPLVEVPAGQSIPPVYRYLATIPAGQAIVELPMEDWVSDARLESTTRYMYYSTVHWHPLLNGYSGFAPAQYSADAAVLRGFPSAQSLDLLRGYNIQIVVLHSQYYTAEEWNTLLAALPAQPQLELLQVYRSTTGDDLVLRIRYAG